MQVSKAEAAARLRRIVQNARGDDLERAQMAFNGITAEAMDYQYGQSGKTRRQLLEEYEQYRREWQAARDLLEALLTQTSAALCGKLIHPSDGPWTCTLPENHIGECVSEGQP